MRVYKMRLPNWYKVEKNGVKFYQVWNLHSSGLVKHGFSTRIGGVSSAPYDTLNMGIGSDDVLENVVENRKRFAEAVGVDVNRLVVPYQVHSNTVRVVGESDAGSGALKRGTAIPETDALITNVPNLPLALHFADCVSIFLLDPEHKAIGLVHAGWRGTASKIVLNAIEAMQREYNTDPKSLLAAIGPAINRMCYEIGEDAAKELFKAFPHDERVLKPFSLTKWHADLKIANLQLLKTAGIEEPNIAVSEECTCCNREEFFSYRRDGESGRMSGWLCLA